MIKLLPLRGLIPKADIRDAAGQAEIAENIDFSDGYLRPWCEPVQIAKAPDDCSTPYIKDGRVRFSDPATTFVTDSVCGIVYSGNPCDCPLVYKDWCSDDEPIALGLPVPHSPLITSGDTVVDDEYADYISIVIRYVNEDCPGCPIGPASLPSNQVKCHKEDTLDVALPPLPTDKYEITHIEVYRLASTWDVSQGMHDPASDGFVGNNIFGGHDTAVSAQYFRVSKLPVSASGTSISIDCSMPLGTALICKDNFPPPDGMCLAGETVRGSLVGFQGCHLLFSQRNMYYGFPQHGCMSFGADIDAACVWGDTVFVLLKTGELYIVLDDITGAETGECRSVQLVRKTRRTAGGKCMGDKQRMCDHTGFTWITDQGIMRASLNGNVINLTHPWFGYSEWLQTVPSKMTMAEYRSALFFSSPNYSGVLDMNSRGELTGEVQSSHSTLRICPDCWISDCDGRLYFMSCGIFWEFNAGSKNMRMRWRSAVMSEYGSYSVGYVDFADIAKNESLGQDAVFTMTTYHKGQCTAQSINCTRDRCCFRLRRHKAHDIQLEYNGTEPIRALCAGATMTGLQSLQ